MRQIVLDTETTGLETSQGHRIIEIGCVELVSRKLTGNNLHIYINPEREIDDGAIEVHGITNEFLEDKPTFSAIAQQFYDYVKGAELVIHNAAFDVGFLDYEFSLLEGKAAPKIKDYCQVVDTLKLARQKHPGQKNNLDALCKRYFVDNSKRDLHGALLDAEILADVYLLMTGGQVGLSLDAAQGNSSGDQQYNGEQIRRLPANRPPLTVIMANDDELSAHEAKLDVLDKSSDGAVWRKAAQQV